jgi:hypothetical protein
MQTFAIGLDGTADHSNTAMTRHDLEQAPDFSTAARLLVFRNCGWQIRRALQPGLL